MITYFRNRHQEATGGAEAEIEYSLTEAPRHASPRLGHPKSLEPPTLWPEGMTGSTLLHSMAKNKGNSRQRKGGEQMASSMPGGTAAAPGHFLALTVRNVRCFADTEQTLKLCDERNQPARWTLLLGNNGTGKTTLLQSLAALAPGTLGFPGIQMKQPLWVPAGINPLRPLLRDWSPTRVAERAMSISARVLLDWRFTGGRGAGRTLEVGLQIGGDAVRSASASGDTSSTIECFGYGPARRLSPSTVVESEVEDPCASLFADDADLRNPEEWLLRLDYSASKQSDVRAQQRRRLTRVKRILCDLLPDVRQIRITEPTEKTPTPSAQFQTPYGWVPLRGLGHGYQSLVAWVVDFASRMFGRYPDSENPLAEPAVALIDEIDLHLHPAWQRRVMGHLTEQFPNTQFIASAHSPLIVQAAQDANVVLLRREGDHVVIENDVKAVRNWRIDQILTSDLYGLATARPPQLEDKLKRRKALLTRSRLTKKDKAELAKLQQEIGDLPGGETAEETEKLQRLVDETRSLLEKYGD